MSNNRKMLKRTQKLVGIVDELLAKADANVSMVFKPKPIAVAVSHICNNWRKYNAS